MEQTISLGYRALNVRHDEVVKIVSYMRAQYKLSELLSTFDVPRSSYSYHRQRMTRPCEERERIKVKMKAIHQASRGSAGSRTITGRLRGLDESIGRYKVR